MARYSGATWRPVAWANGRDDNTPAKIVVLHLTASEADSQYGWFNSSRSACSHFHIARNGHVEQYIDTDKLSAAEYKGSNDVISIETEGADADGEWGSAQVEAIIRLLVWLHREHGIPLALKTSSRPTEPGIAWHRLGVSGNFPTSPAILRGRNQRGYAGEPWSTSFGKVCPGNRRILQIQAIRDEAQRRVNGSAPSTPSLPQPSWRGAMGWDKLRPGDTGAEVKALQVALVKLGYSVGSHGADGRFGGDTERAVKAFQSASSLLPDGVVGERTQAALKTATATATPVSNPKPAPAPAPKPAPKPATTVTTSRDDWTMKKLDLRNAHKTPVRDPEVKKLQGLLLARGVSPIGLTKDGKPDGVAGATTRKRVGELQAKTNTGDGKGNADFIVGAGTWTVLIEK